MKKKREKRNHNYTRFRKRDTKLSGAQSLIAELIRHYKGATKINNFINANLPKDQEPFRYQCWITWRNRGAVPMKHVHKLSNILDIPQAALNFYGYQDFYDIEVDWEEMLEECYFLTDEQLKDLKRRKP